MIRILFRKMMWTQIMSAMTVTLCMLVDSIFIGRFLGVESMSAYGFASPVLLIFAALGSMVSAGVQVVCGRTMGTGDREGTDACFTVSTMLAAVISGVGVVLVLCLAGPLCGILGAGSPGPGNPVHGLTKEYLIGFILGAPAFIAAQIMVPYMQMSGNRSRLVIAVGLMTVSDVAFDTLNVFVFHGGTFGMGLASSLSYVAAFVIGAAYFFKKDCMFHFRKTGIRWKVLLSVIKNGVPTVINQISLVLLVLLLNNILKGVGGYKAVAAYSAISTVGNICYSFGTGVASVALMLGTMFYTDEDKTSLRVLVKEMMGQAVKLDAAVTAAVLLLAQPLARLFLTDHPEALEMTVEGIRLFSLCLVPCSLNTALKNYYQGIGRERLTEAISVVQNFLLTALFAFGLSRFMGVRGVWLAFACGETGTLILISMLVWKRYGRVSVSADAYAMLPGDFGVPEDACMELTARSVEEVMAASEQAEAFCLSHGQPKRVSMLVALCIEEIACNIVHYGFGQDKQPHLIDIRLVFSGEDRLIRIRDNCAHFDPLRYLELHKSDDKVAHLGIHMVMGMTKDAVYINSMGLNHLSLRL